MKAGVNKKRLLLLAVVVLISGLISACSGDSAAKESAYGPGLIVLAGSTDVQFRKQEAGYDLLEYRINEAYPAKSALAKISERLRKTGWQPLNSDLLNPDSPSSHVTGWTQFVDATVTPETRVHQWLAPWKDKNGNVVSYALRYREPDLSKLTIWALYYPSTVVKSLQDKAKAIRSDPRFAPSPPHSYPRETSNDQLDRLNESGDINLFLRAAAENGRLNLVKIAVSRGASVDAADGYKTTALIAAARNGHIEVVKYLLERGANVNARARDGTTAVIVAAEKGYVDTLRVLIKNGADLRKNRCGETALKLAQKNGHSEVVALLKAAGIN